MGQRYPSIKVYVTFVFGLKFKFYQLDTVVYNYNHTKTSDFIQIDKTFFENFIAKKNPVI